MKTTVSVVGCKILGCSTVKALEFIQDLKRITGYEPKINEAQVTIKNKTQGEYSTYGFFSGVPWRGRFEYTLHEHGFHSYMTGGWLKNCMQGGFVVLPHGDQQCQLWHYEEYRFPRASILLRPGLRAYLRRAMHRELCDIELLLQKALQRNGEFTSIDADSKVAVVNRVLLPEMVPEATVADLFEGEPLATGGEVQMKALAELSVKVEEAKSTCCHWGKRW